MTAQRVIRAKGFDVRKVFGKGELIIEIMDAIMTEAADKDALVKLLLAEVLAVECSPVEFARDKMMKGQRSGAATKATQTRRMKT